MRRSSLVWLAAVAVTLGVLASAATLFTAGALPCGLVSVQPRCELALVPGPTEDTLGLVRIDGARTYPSSGRLLLTTVAVREVLDLESWWQARRSPRIDTVPRETIYPEGLERDEVDEHNELLMADSQSTAALAALQAVGYDVAAAVDGAAVAAVEPDAVTDALAVGDVVVAIDGTPVRDAAQAVDLVTAAEPGHTATLTVRDEDGRERTETVTYGANPSDPSRPYIGVLLTTELDLPVDVTIDAGVIGGPSAGLMFALGVVELLGEEDLTGGATIAGTGTITVDGEVGPVGGVRQKVIAASTRQGADAGATVFLVPRANLGEARRAPVDGDVLLVPVDDLDGAVAALEALREGRDPAGALALDAPGED